MISQNNSKSRAETHQADRNGSLLAGSASKLSRTDLNNLLRALDIDVVALTEILVPKGHRAEMGMIDAPALHYTLCGMGSISINGGPKMPLEPHLLIIKPPNTPFSIEVEGDGGPLKLINRDCWKRDEGLLRIAAPNGKAEVVQICEQPGQAFPHGPRGSVGRKAPNFSAR